MKLLVVSVLLLIPALGRAQVQGMSRHLLTQRDILQTLSGSDVEAKPLRISMPVGISSSIPQPPLRVSQPTLVGCCSVRLRLACESSATCLSFYASLEFAEAQPASALCERLLLTRRVASQKVAISPPPLHAGQHITLILTNGQMQITLPAILVDSGSIGDEVRVASLDHKSLYRARVAADGILKGSLP